MKTRFLTPVLTSVAIVLMAIGCDSGTSPKNSVAQSKQRISFFEPEHPDPFTSPQMQLSDATPQQAFHTGIENSGPYIVSWDCTSSNQDTTAYTMSIGSVVHTFTLTGAGTFSESVVINNVPVDAEITFALLGAGQSVAADGRPVHTQSASCIVYADFYEGAVQIESAQ